MSKAATVIVAATPEEIPTAAVGDKPTTVYWNIWLVRRQAYHSVLEHLVKLGFLDEFFLLRTTLLPD